MNENARQQQEQMKQSNTPGKNAPGQGAAPQMGSQGGSQAASQALEAARGLAEAGADVAVSARTATELEQLIAEIQAMGRKSLAISCDVTDPQQVQSMVARSLEDLGGIDILVNNAGYGKFGEFAKLPLEENIGMIQLNMVTLTILTKLFLGPMLCLAQPTSLPATLEPGQAEAREDVGDAPPLPKEWSHPKFELRGVWLSTREMLLPPIARNQEFGTYTSSFHGAR